MTATFMSPESRARRETALKEMRERFARRVSAKARRRKRRKAADRSARRASKSYRPRSDLAIAVASLQINQHFWANCRPSAAHQAAYRLKIKIKTRTVHKNGVKGIRIWRVEKSKTGC